MQASRIAVWQIKHGDDVVLEGDDLRAAITDEVSSEAPGDEERE
jgi:hypothetical protein